MTVAKHRTWCVQTSKEFETAEEDLNDSLARLGQLLKDTAGGHSRAVVWRPGP